MVSEDGVDAATRAQASEHLGAGPHVLALVRDVVARQGDDVGLKAVCDLDGALNLLAPCERAVVYVGQLEDLQSVQCARQSLEADGVALDGELVRLGEGCARNLNQAGSYRAKGSRAPLGDTSPLSPTVDCGHLLSL